MREVGRRILSRLQEIHKRNQRLLREKHDRKIERLDAVATIAEQAHHDAVMGVKAGVGNVDAQLKAGRVAVIKRVKYNAAREKKQDKKK
jgi:hypothetical protein